MLTRYLCLIALVLGSISLTTPDASAKENAGDGESEENQALYFKLRPNLVVNLKGNNGANFLMLTTMVRSRRQSDLTAIEYHMGALRHELLMLLTEKSAEELLTVAGKESLRKAALSNLQAFFKRETGEEVIEGVYFTDFVLE